MEQKLEKLLYQLSEMETINPCDKLSKLIQQTADEDDELDEYDLEQASAARLQPYREFLKRLEKQTDMF